MREIKFMAWDKKLKRLISNEEFAFSPYFIQADGKVIICDPGNEEHNFEELKDYILMQYTGLKDKNDKEIYEGYIVRLTDIDNELEIFTVIWEKSGYFTLKPFIDNEGYVPTLGYFTDRDSNDNYYTIEIIGNIYENPELLEKKPT